MRPDHFTHRPVRTIVFRAGLGCAVLACAALTYAAISTKVTLDRRSAFAASMAAGTVTNVSDFATRVNPAKGSL